jgi:ABC-type multidrug transport system fused ATPase/permease subunit
VAFLQYVRRFFQPVRDLADKYNILQAAMAASERVFALLDQKVEEESAAETMRPVGRLGEVHFEDVWFAYNSGEWVLRGVTFHIKEGETVALVGATGAGKSSLIGLLDRAYNAEGKIIVDGIDIRQWQKEALRQHVGIIPQDVFLFSGSLIENLRLWNPNISPSRVREVAESLGIESFINDLTDGYDTEIKDRGMNLSLGQRQLLAFVRILLYDPRLLILDEATSSVDPQTEALIQETMPRITKGRTSLIIAHRLTTIRRADRILVLHRGKIREEGTHEELISLDGVYKRLYQLQADSQGSSPSTQTSV